MKWGKGDEMYVYISTSKAWDQNLKFLALADFLCGTK